MSKHYDEVTRFFQKGEEIIDNFWNVLEHPDFPFVTLTSTTNGFRNFPPYNIIESEDGKVRLEMALAGYTKDQIKVEKEGSTLLIQGTAKLPSENVRHHGISSAAFVRAFDLKPGTEIGDVQLKDGILTVNVTSQKPVVPPRTTYQIA